MATTRYTIDLDKAFDASLAKLAEKKGTTKADIIRRALATYSFLSTQTADNPQRKVSITNNEDKVLKDLMLP